MNQWPNGTFKVGAPFSYQNLLSGLEDILKGKGRKAPKVFEIHHFGEKIKEAGLKIGLTKERINQDWQDIHNKTKEAAI